MIFNSGRVIWGLKKKRRTFVIVAICAILMVEAVLGTGISLGTVIASGGTINERLAVELTEGRNGSVAQTGETLYAKVVSRYSKANNPKENVKVGLKIGKLPEEISVAGFENGQKKVIWQDEEKKEHDIVLQLVEEEGELYVEFEQPAGATVEFEIQFNSSNGIGADGECVTLEIDKEKVQGLDSPIGENDYFSEPLTLTWHGKNEWEPVDKKVNGVDKNKILVNSENQLAGELTYTITANSLNNEKFGEIWTDYITVTDTLQLPEDVAFPEEARVNESNTAIVDANGNTICYFSKLQQDSEITAITLEGKKVNFQVKVPNTYKKDGVPTREQDHLALEMKLNANLLVVAENYARDSAIENQVAIQPVPYKPYDVKGSADSAVTVLVGEKEEIIIKKEADKKAVQAGDTVTYTLSVENNGKCAIKVLDENGVFYQVTDELPVYLYLTREQIAGLPEDVTYNEETNTICWVPGREDIASGMERHISFQTTVKEATDEVMRGLSNGSLIKNVAQYKKKYSNEVNLLYEKAEVQVEKTSKDEDGDGKVSNGEKITYIIRVSNDTDLNAVMDEVVTDTLPKGLIFESATIGINQNITQSGTYILHYGIGEEKNKHEVEFQIDGQTLCWNVGSVHAHEEIVLTYVCKVDVDQLDGKTQIVNKVTTSSEKEDYDVVKVDPPIDLEKTVEQDTNVIYPDKTIFDYKISLKNDTEHPSQNENLQLTDSLPIGMLPVDCTLIQHQKVGTMIVDTEISWEDFWQGNISEEASTFTSVIDGRRAEVRKSWNGIVLVWNIGKMSAGEEITIKYRAQITLTEKQKSEGGQYGFTNRARIDNIRKSVTVYGGETAEPGTSADIQKSVWAIKKEKVKNESVLWQNWYDKEQFSLDLEEENEKNLVIYNMTVINTGSDAIHLSTLKDVLPKELTYIGIDSVSWNFWQKRGAFTQEIVSNAYGCLNTYEANKLVSGVKINSDYKEKENQVEFTFNQAEGGYELESGKALTFLMLCEVNEQAKTERPIVNTAQLMVDEKVSYLKYEEIKTRNTPYDYNQNNGNSMDEGITEGKRTISSTVAILPKNVIVPGINKKAVSYIIPGKTEEMPLDETSNIQPNATVKWEIDLYNDGTVDLADYDVEDSVTTSFHLITEKEAEKKQITEAYKLEIYSYDGQKQQEFDLSKQVWSTVTEDSNQSNYKFRFSGEKYGIPPGGCAKLTLYTNNTVENYKVYKNTATILPDTAFAANKVKHGELKKDNEGNYIGVTSSDEVNALGDYASVSWKSAAEKGKETNTARGTQEKNYISVGMGTEYVTYKNNIRNVSENEFGRLVLIDVTPGNNDTGVINQNDVRGSEFSIAFADNLEVYVLENGQKVPVEGYQVEFSPKVRFTQKDFDGVEEKEWHEIWQEGDRSFRVTLPENFKLLNEQTLVVQYDGKLGPDAKPGAIAWNSFGYQYYSGNHTKPMKSEPPKVGVKMPKIPMIQKEVVDAGGEVQNYDESKVFTFTLSQKDAASEEVICEFQVCQGGYILVSDLKDKNGNKVVLENGGEYVVAEVTDKMPEGYQLIGIGEKGSAGKEKYSFVYYDSKDITILARNEVDTYQPEIPETGGTGTTIYTLGGIGFMGTACLMQGYRLRRRRGRRCN